jgi:hypothetical protein
MKLRFLLLSLLLACSAQADDMETIQALRAKSEAFKGKTVVFKGFYLGMPSADAQTLLNHYLGFEKTSSQPRNLIMDQIQLNQSGERPEKPWETQPFQVYEFPPGSSSHIISQSFAIQGMAGAWFFAETDDHGKVTRFNILKRVSARLFDSGEMNCGRLAHSFAEAYGLTNPEEGRENIYSADEVAVTLKMKYEKKLIGRQNYFRCQNRELGYEITFWDDVIFETELKDSEIQIGGGVANSITIRSIGHLKKFD